ncbi:MAG: hypothetical protein FWC01_03855 [Treponema sp.]|nr:hypothetical protein [Treponema sp.]
MKFYINKLIILSCFILLTNCIEKKEAENPLNGIDTATQIKAMQIESYNMKSIYFEVDGMLYVLAILSLEEENKIFDLKIKDANNPLLYNGPNIYTIRAGYYNNDIIHSELLYKDQGYSAKYVISHDCLQYSKLGDELIFFEDCDVSLSSDKNH